MVYDPEAAAEITLQPLRRFAFDGAILFSDILIVPHAIGQELTFVAGEGPRLAPPLSKPRWTASSRCWSASSRSRRPWPRVKAALSPETTFLGFAGSPWTVATYMVAGQGSREQAEARALAYLDPGKFAAIIARIEAITVDYLSGQVEAGVDAVQLFDSWSGSLAPAEFERWVIAPTARIVAALRARHPARRSSAFPRAPAANCAPMPRETGVDAIGLDETVDPGLGQPRAAGRHAGPGQSRPAGADRRRRGATDAVQRILDALAGRPHIFNLGHGIQQTRRSRMSNSWWRW